CFVGNVGESAVAVVVEEDVHAVIRDVQVLETVAIKVRRGSAHSEVAHLATRDAGFVSYISESAVAVVAVESVLDRSLGSVKIRWAAVDQIDIHPTIVIKIEEQATSAARLGQVS